MKWDSINCHNEDSMKEDPKLWKKNQKRNSDWRIWKCYEPLKKIEHVSIFQVTK